MSKNKITWIDPYQELPTPVEYNGYEIFRPSFSTMFFEIRSLGNKPLPEALAGSFTSPNHCKVAIDGYLASLVSEQTIIEKKVLSQ